MDNTVAVPKKRIVGYLTRLDVIKDALEARVARTQVIVVDEDDGRRLNLTGPRVIHCSGTIRPWSTHDRPRRPVVLTRTASSRAGT